MNNFFRIQDVLRVPRGARARVMLETAFLFPRVCGFTRVQRGAINQSFSRNMISFDGARGRGKSGFAEFNP